MKQITAAIIAVCVAASPANAQEGDTEVQDGFNLMEEGAKLLLRGLMSEIEPTLDEMRESLQEMGPLMRDFMTEMGPAMLDLLADVDDFRHYAAPEFLPNGDIIIRRRPDAPFWVPENLPEEIEL